MLAWLLTIALTWAQEPEAPAGPRLPVLVSTVPAVFDPAELDAVTGDTVLVELAIDETGRVASVDVLEPLSPTLDAAAVAALRDHRFEPALDESGTPAFAVVQFRFTFSRTSAATVSLIGKLVRAGGGGPLVDGDVTLVGTDGTERTAVTGDDGTFRVGGLADGTWTVTVTEPGYEPESASLTIATGSVAEVTLYPVAARPWELQEDVEVVTIVGQRIAPEVVERPLRADEIAILPGSGGDVVRAVQNLPGVARAPFGIGQLIIRGTAPEDSRYTVDGMEIPLVFHFSGLTTVLAGDLLDEVVFLPGNFGVRYGRNLGGRVDLRTSSVIPEKSRGFVSVDLYQAAAFGEFRVNERTSVTVAARRSYIDAVLTPILSKGGSTVRAPRYYDGQLRVVHRPQSGGVVDALLLFSDDRFVVLSDEQAEAGEKKAAAIGLSTTFLKGRFRWERPLNDIWRNELSLLVGPDTQEFKFQQTGQAYERRFSFDVREELIGEFDDGGRVRVGFDLQTGALGFLYDVESFGEREKGGAPFVAPALYAEGTWVGGPVTLVSGVRADVFRLLNDYTGWSIDPRLTLRYRVGRTTTLTAAIGRFSQFPTARQVQPEGDGTATLTPAWSLQSAIGLVQVLPADIRLEVSAFYNRLFDLVVGREDRVRFFTGPPPSGPFDTDPYGNDGTGMICGAELLLKYQGPRVAAWLSGTFGRSFRTGRLDDERAPFAYDQPWVISALATGQLGKGWRLGGRIRFSAGNPYTPVEQRLYDLESRGYVPLYAAANSARIPPFLSADLRVDKQWTFKKWALTFFLDLQNISVKRNIELVGYSWDFAVLEPTTAPPLLPVFGLRGDF